MAGEYLIWWHRRVPHACVLNELTGLDRQFRLNNGTPLAADFPPGVALHMDPDFPDDLLVTDSLRNADMLVVASDPLADVIRKFATSGVEFLPVKIIDHKGRSLAGPFHIVHPIDPVDAIDRERSVFEEDLLEPGAIESIDKLVLDPARIPPDRAFFRLAGFWDATLVRRDLADAVIQSGATGVRFLDVDDYPER